MGIFEKIKKVFGASEKKQFIERGERFRIFREMDAIEVKFNKQILSIINISSTGLAVNEFPLGEKVKGVLNFKINGKTFDVPAQLARRTSGLIAFKFFDIPEDFNLMLFRLFDVERRSKELHFVSPTLINQTQYKGDVSWYRGSNGDELFFSYTGNTIHQLQAQVMGHALEYREGGKIRAGRLEKAADKGYSPWVLTEAQEGLRKIFGRYVENIDALLPEHRQMIIDLLQSVR